MSSSSASGSGSGSGTILVSSATGSTLNDAQLKQYAKSQLGFTFASNKQAAFQQALTDPTTYLKNRDAELLKAEDAISQEFTDVYKRVLGLGYTDDQSKQVAFNAANNRKNTELAVVDMLYPPIFQELSQNQISKTTYNKNPFLGSNLPATINKTRHRKKKYHKK